MATSPVREDTPETLRRERRPAPEPARFPRRGRRSAVFAILTAINVPIIHFSVIWWKTLHQGASVFTSNRTLKVHGSMAFTLLLSFVAFTLTFFWFLRIRYRIEVARDHQSHRKLVSSIEQRRNEVPAS